MLSLLRVLPGWAWAVAAALAWGAVQHHKAAAAGTRALTAEKALSDLRAEAAQTTITALARTAAAQQEAVNAASIEAERGRADAAGARAAAGRMLKRAAAAGRAAGACAAASAGSAPAGGADLVPADVLGRVAEAAGQLAAVADQRGTAGAACERVYEAVVDGGR